MKRYFFLCALAVIFGLFLPGCSFFKPGRQMVAVTIEPGDATLIANGAEYFTSPMFINVRRNEELMLIAYKENHKKVYRTIDYQLSNTGILDACFSFLIIPGTALFHGGAWELKEDNIVIKLEPLDEKKPEDEKNGDETPDAGKQQK